MQNIFRIWSSVLTKLMTIGGSVGKWKVVGGSLDQWSMGQRSVDLIKRNRCNFNGLFNANLSSVLNLIFIKSLPYSPFLPPFIVSISFLIPSKSSVYFLLLSFHLQNQKLNIYSHFFRTQYVYLLYQLSNAKDLHCKYFHNHQIFLIVMYPIS